MKVLGADACPAGWFVTVIDGGDVSTDMYESFERLRHEHTGAHHVLVDIPIGLPTDERRRCDEAARELLGCRGNSVFYSPSEGAIECTDYDEANDTHREDLGHGLSQQAYHISDKIREVRSAVGSQYDGNVRESHPELCFAALNGQPIAYSKSSDSGQSLRLELLGETLNDAKAIYGDVRDRRPLTEVGRDDILDAMVLAVAARHDSLATVPSDPDTNEPRIYYPEFEVPSSPLV